MNKRMRALKRSIRDYIHALPAEPITPPEGLQALARYTYPASADRLADFSTWLDTELERGVLSRSSAGGMWTEDYIDSAYKAGRRRAVTELHKEFPDAAYTTPEFPDDDLGFSFMAPIHVDDLKVLYARDFTTLRGLSDDVARRMSEVLAIGMAEGRGPGEIARIMRDGLGIPMARARTIARTEIIRAHHRGLWRIYAEAGIEGVTFQVEWLAARDDRMCPECGFLDGRTYRLEDVPEAIPLHPNCRCCMIPVPSTTAASEGYEEVGESWDDYYRTVIRPGALAKAIV